MSNLIEDYSKLLCKQFNNKIAFCEKREGIIQLFIPFYHEDGDMIDIFLELREDKKIRICDFGMTLMHLSYEFDIDTENKEKVLDKILSENGISNENGNLFVDVTPQFIYQGVLQYAQTVSKVSNMRILKRELISSLFYDMLSEYIESTLTQYSPQPKVLPIARRPDLEVDFSLKVGTKNIFLFGLRDVPKARLIIISCLEFQKAKLPFKSVIIHEDFDALPKNDRIRLTNAADKQFATFDDFKENAINYFEREAV